MTSHKEAVELAWQALPDNVASELTFRKVEAAILAYCNARKLRIHDDNDARRAQFKTIILEEIRGRVAISKLLKTPKLKRLDSKFVLSLVDELADNGELAVVYNGRGGSVSRRTGWTVQ